MFYGLAPNWLISYIQRNNSHKLCQVRTSNLDLGINQPWIINGGEVEWVSLNSIDPTISISLTTYMNTVKLSISGDLGFTPKDGVSCKKLLK